MRSSINRSYELVGLVWDKSIKKLVVLAGILAVTNIVQAQVPLGNISKIGAGIDTTCTITSDSNAVQCWGKNHYQLDTVTPNSAMATAQYAPLAGTNVAEVIIGNNHTCIRTYAGAVKCWGQNFYGQLGNGTTNNSTHSATGAVGLNSGVVAIAAGLDHVCALTDIGAVKCWGRNQFGQLGINSSTNSLIPTTVIGLGQGAVAIAARGNHSCALLNTGTVQCWGSNSFNELSNGTFAQSNVPVEIQNLNNVQKITAGENHNCALISDGTVRCWGANDYGQSGVDVELPYVLIPVEVQNLSNAIDISASGKRSCALFRISSQQVGASVKCWGSNLDSTGSLGQNTEPYSSSAAEISGWESGVSTIAVGDYHTCAVNISGNVSCFGWNQLGQLGDNTLIERTNPEPTLQAMKPQIGHLTTFNGEAIVRFAPPVNDSGSQITGYTIITSPESGLDNQADTLDSYYGPDELSHLITGLTNGTYYSFRVRATNALGTGLLSDSTYGTPAAVTCDMGNVILGETYNGTFTTTDCTDSVWGDSSYTRRFIYYGSAGDQLALQTNMGGRLYLLGKQGIRSSTAQRIPSLSTYFTLDYSGPYVIEVSPYDVGQTGSYSFSVVGPNMNSSTSSSSSTSNSSSIIISSVASSASSNQPSSSGASSPTTSSTQSNSSATSNSPSFSSSASSFQSTSCSALVTFLGSTINGSLAAGDCQSGARGTNYYTDIYSFSGTVGQQIYIQLSSSAFDTYLYLKSSNGTVIASNDDSGGSTNSRVPITSGYFTLPANGTYTIEVSSYSNFAVGTYTLILAESTSSGSSSISSSSSSLSEGCVTTSLAFGVVNGNLATTDCTNGARGASYYTDRFSFTATAGLQISVLLTSTIFDTYVYLKSPNGSLLTSNDDGGGGTNSRIPALTGTYIIPSDGTYIIEVTSYSTRVTGSYILQLN